jgi:uncharacterized membrane protein
MFVVSGILLVLLAIPLVTRKIKPNGYYGFRVKKTMENPDIWYSVNSYAGKWLLATGVIELMASIGLYSIPGINIDSYSLSVLAFFGIAFLAAIIASVRYMSRLS